MSPRKASVLALTAAIFAAAAAQADPDAAAVSTANILAHATTGENGNEGGLALWTAVCPLVSGIPQEQGEQILARVLEIAQDGGIALAGEKCIPNLYILFSSDPKQLLEGMKKKNLAFTFSCGIKDPGPETSDGAIEQFIHEPRVVRAWYNTTVTTPDGSTVCNDRRSLQRHTDASNVEYTARWHLLTTFVVIDTTRLAGISEGQLADYIALVSLIRMNPDVQLQDAQTILRLFRGSPSSVPSGITVWDRALLKTIYGGSQESKQQRQQLAKRMIAEVQRAR